MPWIYAFIKFSGFPLIQSCKPGVIPLFNNLVVNETSKDVDAVFLNSKYILPKESSFFMVWNTFYLNHINFCFFAFSYCMFIIQ